MLIRHHAEEKSLAIYRDLALADVSPEYQEAMRPFQSAEWGSLLRTIADSLMLPLLRHLRLKFNFRLTLFLL